MSSGPRRQAKSFDALLDEMLEMPESQRKRWVDSLPAAYAEHQPRLSKLLARTQRQALLTLPNAQLSSTSVFDMPHDIGSYQLLRPLGKGGMASVWLARDTRHEDHLVALKIVQHGRLRAGFEQRLAREQQLLAALEHPNIVRFHETIRSHEGLLVLVLEYVEGLTLDRYCAEHALSLVRRFALGVQIADALVHAHARSIVHRDLKPNNVLVTRSGEARLLDFGVAKLLDETAPDQPQLSAAFGRPLTLAYASPEQVLGHELHFATDVYSLGVVMYELATGRRPYAGSSGALRNAIVKMAPRPPSEAAEPSVRPLLAGAIDRTLLRALDKDPARRHASMRELAAELEEHTRMLGRSERGA